MVDPSEMLIPLYYKTNIQRIEAIGVEDLAGLPVFEVPQITFISRDIRPAVDA